MRVCVCVCSCMCLVETLLNVLILEPKKLVSENYDL